MNLVILGEAATKLLAEQGEFRERHPQLPWRSLRAVRNRVAHGYFEVNLDLVWEMVKARLPELVAELPAIRQTLPVGLRASTPHRRRPVPRLDAVIAPSRSPVPGGMTSRCRWPAR